MKNTKFNFLMAFIIITAAFLNITAEEKKKGKVFNRDFSKTKKVTAIVETHEGTMTFDLLFKDAPNTVANFMELSNSGFYNGLIFHMVIQGFQVQGGDPEGTGAGGPGYTIDDEKNDNKHEAGSLGMLNKGSNSGGSQFYVTHMPQPHLDGRHTIFGKIESGFDVLMRIEKGDIIKSIKIKEEKN